ncbi:MAG: hypothetical protein WAS05_03400 [Candidatus Nanopelagicales bacterium]
MNALVWLLIPVVVTCFAAWWLAQRAQAAERDDPNGLSPAELEKMQQALDKTPIQNPGETNGNSVDKGPSQ